MEIVSPVYNETKDITELGKEMTLEPNSARLFSMTGSKPDRRELERAYEKEKSKTAIARHSNRIYEDYLPKLDRRLYKHVKVNDVVPELHLTR